MKIRITKGFWVVLTAVIAVFTLYVMIRTVAHIARTHSRIAEVRVEHDRLLRGTRATTIGVAYACQLCDDIEPDDFDVPVHYVITEDEIIRVR